MSVRRYGALVTTLIRHGGRVIDSPRPRITSSPHCPSSQRSSQRRYDDDGDDDKGVAPIPNAVPTSELSLDTTSLGYACYTERCLALDLNRALNVTEMSMRCRRRLTPSLCGSPSSTHFVRTIDSRKNRTIESLNYHCNDFFSSRGFSLSSTESVKYLLVGVETF